MKKWVRDISLTLFTFLVVATTTFSRSALCQAAIKDTFTIGIAAEFETLNPIIAQQAATNYLLYLAYRPLLAMNPEGKWVGILIKEIPTIENKLAKKEGKGLLATYEINSNVKWGDGVPVTCKDVEFSWQLALNKHVSVGSRETYERITAITWDKSNDHKCTFHYKEAKYDYYMDMIDIVSEHIERPIYEKFKDTPEGYDHNSAYIKDSANPGLYNGPYLVSEVKLGSHVIFVQNPHFYGKKPAFKKVIFKLIPNNNTLLANIRSGDIDFIATAGGISLDQAVPFEKTITDNKLPYKVVYEEGVLYGHIDVNMDTPILKDIRVRKALMHAFDRKQITKSIFFDKPTPALHFVTKKDPWYTEDVPKYDYSKAKANALLDEAGWKMGPDGVRVKDGEKLKLRITAAAEAKVNEMIETYLQSQFKSIGIELTLKNEPARVFFGDTLKKRKTELALFSWSSLPESSPRSTLFSNMIPSEKNSWSGQNSPGYNVPEVDKLINDLELEMKPKERAKIAKKILTRYVEDVPVLPLYYRPVVTVIPSGLKNFKLVGHKHYETLWIENWEM